MPCIEKGRLSIGIFVKNTLVWFDILWMFYVVGEKHALQTDKE